MIEPKVFSVGQINRYIKNLLENDFILNSLLVQGRFPISRHIRAVIGILPSRTHRGRLPA